MIRQRYKKNESVATIAIDPFDSAAKSHDHQHTIDSPNAHHDASDTTTTSDVYYFTYIFHVLSLLIVLIGIRLTFRTLYTHVECDMTWSQRQFIPVDAFFNNSQENENKYHNYKFYKFIDQRDPRYQHLHTKSVLYANDSSIMNNWCYSSSSNIVLYVPGHGGSYQQSRSLGAHGVQLTHQSMDRREILHELSVQKLRSRDTDHGPMNNATSTTIEDFIFDVYAFDFNEEGGAFHGTLLERQATYIVSVITTLTVQCRQIYSNSNEPVKIHIVAHSIGGISTRLALQQLQLHR